MQTIITAVALYALKAAIALALLYTPYILFMRKETHFSTNRTTLLLAMLLSLATPFIDIPALHIEAPFIAGSKLAETFIQITAPQGSIMVEQGEENIKMLTMEDAVYYFLSLPYIIITLIVAARRAIEIFTIRRNIKRRALWREEREGYTIYCHASTTLPYSWMRSIVISQEDYKNFGKEIILHEEGHIRHRHSWDMLLLAAIETLQWFNPFVHILATDLKDVHEFQADAYVLQREDNSKNYQLLIIRKAVGHASYTLANSFNHSNNLKKRITMMLKKKSNPVRCATALYILPAAALTLSLFAPPQETVGSNLVTEPASVHKSSETFAKSDTIEQKIYNVVEQVAKYPGGTYAMFKYLATNMRYPEDAKNEKKEGRSYIKFVIDTDGSLSNIKVMKSSGHESLDKEAMRVVAAMPKWQPAIQGGEKVKSNFVIPVQFRLK